jgi:thioredoxin 1
MSTETRLSLPAGDTAPETNSEKTNAEVILFSSRSCVVCRTLKPKIRKLLADEFPQLHLREIDCDQEPEQTLRFGVRTVPTVILRFAGQETARRERVFSLGQLRDDIERPYRIYFAV